MSSMAKRKAPALLAAFLAAAVACGCAARREEAAATGWERPLTGKAEGREIEEYRGEPLDSVGVFPDNSIAGPQRVDLAAYRLSVDGLVERRLSLSYEEALALPRTERLVTLHCVEGWSATVLWEGFRLFDLLDLAGADPGASTLVFEAVDGYSTSLPLADARARDLIVAAKANGLPLDPSRGFPFQLVAEDRWGYKWIKWLDRITVSAESDYRGYWEERGYSADGSLERPRFEEGPEAAGARPE